MIKKSFQEHCSRAAHFVLGAGSARSEQFTPFAALHMKDDKKEDSKPAGDVGPGEKKGPRLYDPPIFRSYCQDQMAEWTGGANKDVEFEESAIFEFCSKILCEEMRVHFVSKYPDEHNYRLLDARHYHLLDVHH